MKHAIRRYWLPIALALIGVIVALIGVGTATIWRPSSQVTLSASAGSNEHLIVARSGVLDLYSSEAKIQVKGEGKVAIALGRSEDISGWSADQPYTELTGQANAHSFFTAKHTSENSVRSPLEVGGQDMWALTEQGDGSAATTWTPRDGSWSFLVWSESGTPQVTVSWTQAVRTPLLWPLVIAGGVILLLGLIIAVVLNRLAAAARKEEQLAAERREALIKEAATGQTPVVPSIDSVSRPPSRKELREARARGEETVEVEGVKFPTGLVPIIQTDEAGNAIPPTATADSAEPDSAADATDLDSAPASPGDPVPSSAADSLVGQTPSGEDGSTVYNAPIELDFNDSLDNTRFWEAASESAATAATTTDNGPERTAITDGEISTTQVPNSSSAAQTEDQEIQKPRVEPSAEESGSTPDKSDLAELGLSMELSEDDYAFGYDSPDAFDEADSEDWEEDSTLLTSGSTSSTPDTPPGTDTPPSSDPDSDQEDSTSPGSSDPDSRAESREDTAYDHDPEEQR